MIISVNYSTFKHYKKSEDDNSQFRYQVKSCIPETMNYVYRLSYKHSNKYYNVTDKINDHQHRIDKTYAKKNENL